MELFIFQPQIKISIAGNTFSNPDLFLCVNLIFEYINDKVTIQQQLTIL